MLQVEEINKYSKLYIKRYPQLKTRIVDGSSLIAAIVLNSIPQTKQVLLCGNLTKVSVAIANALCEGGIQVYVYIQGHNL